MANPRHDEEELIWYNLACYACVLDKKFEARRRLAKPTSPTEPPTNLDAQ